MTFAALRNFPYFALLVLPLVCIDASVWYVTLERRFMYARLALLAVVTAMVSINFLHWYDVSIARKTAAGIGEWQPASAGLTYLKTAEFKAPVFNNYDIGSYLDFELYDRAQQNIYVDNRPEAYPENFFEEEYKQPLRDPRTWEKLDQKYNFQTIVFWAQDYTDWGQDFLVRIVQDPKWEVVYYDNLTIILKKKA